MCISYVLQHLDERCQFLNFGIGNGKSLLCTSIAIILRKIQPNNVIILNSSEYLTYRDYHKFKDCIDNCGLRCSLNAPEARSITYMDEKNFKLLLKGKKQNFEASKAIIIMDEYD
jgi:preprotein translocase subunit SecA